VVNIGLPYVFVACYSYNKKDQAPKYLRDLTRLSSSAISLRPLRSLDRHDLFVPRARTSISQTQAFAIIGPSLWNQLLPSMRSTLIYVEPGGSFRSLKTAFFALGLSHLKASDWCALQETLYKCIDTIQYNYRTACIGTSQNQTDNWICTVF